MVRKKIKQILKNRSRNNFKNYGRAVLLLLVVGLASYFSFFFVLKVLASPPTSRYLIGETLEPSCAPGSDNCTIVSLAESGTNYDLTSLLGVSGSAKIGIGTSTATTFLDIYPKGSNKNLFYISSTSPGSILVAQKNGYVGIGTTSPGFLLSAGGDVNLKTGGAYRIGGIPVLTLASSSQWNSIGRNGSGLSLVNFADLHPVYTVGDSIMGEGSYQTQLRSLLGNSWDVINQAEAGEDTSMMLTEFQPNIIHRNDAEYIIIWGGINDAGNGVASTTAEANLQSMYTAAHNAGAKVVAINISPFKGASYWSDAHQKTATDINTWINTAAINIDYKIDSYTLLVSSTEPYTLWSKYDSGDHLHPNSTGLNRVASSTYWNVTWTPGVTIHSLRVAGDVYLNQSLRQSDSVGFNQISVNKIQSFWSSGFNGTATYYGPLTLNAGGGSVGMGTTYPNTSYGLDIEAGSSLNGLLIETYKTSGYAIITANSSNIGTYSSSSLTGIIGIGSKGIQGDTAVSTGVGIYGYNAATDGSGAIAVKGVDSSTSGGYGVLGVSNNWLGVQGWTANGYDFYSSLHKSRFEKTGLGNCYPVNQLDVNGGTAIGTYAGVSSA
ncbi:MAG TPA: GDSL-type esterase/lipase family protein, partial [Candidatus Methylomirabilis sp.]|nr:GDSL-type esterase/lipase family protein [Candidatus Methylomirabilis sp.]